MDMLYILLTVLVFLVALGTGAALFVNARQERKKRQLRIIAGQKGVSSAKSETGIRDKRRADLAKKLKEGEQNEASEKRYKLREQIFQAGLDISVRKYWLSCLVLGCVLGGAAKFLLGLSTFVSGLIFITGLLGIPRLFLKFRAARRQKKFIEEFSDALESMVRLLKAGMPVGEAISMVAREFTGPVGEEMARIYDTQKIGVPLAEAAYEGAKRMPLTEMKMFATGLAIQQQTGASLSEILLNLANVIRARHRLKRKVQALSQEAKSSAAIIGALPILVATGLYFINPDFMMPLFTTPPGKTMLGGAITWMCIGVLVMRQMINFKV